MDKEFLDIIEKYLKQTKDYASVCFYYEHINEQERDIIVNNVDKIISKLAKIQPGTDGSEDWIE